MENILHVVCRAAVRLRSFFQMKPLSWLLGFALLIRATSIFCTPNSHFPDEIFQLFEQAHRVAFGYGIVPWEFYSGIRSYVPIYIIAVVFKAVAVFSENPFILIASVRLGLALFSLVPIAAVWRYAAQFSRFHAIIAAVFAASWFEIVYFSVSPLTEALAFDFLLTALCLAAVTKPQREVRHNVAIGFSLAAALMLRVHLAPALLYIAFLSNGLTLSRRTAYLAAGAILPLAAFAIADILTWGAPFAFIYNAIQVNVVHNVASSFGTEPIYAYLTSLLNLWAGAAVVFAALIVVGFKKYRPFVITAIIIIASHSLIPHKEYRFVFAGFALLALVAALSSVDIAEKAKALMTLRAAKQIVPILAGAWILTSLSLAYAPTFRPNWTKISGILNIEPWLAKQPNVCGVGLYQYSIWATGGYSYLHRPVRIVFYPDGSYPHGPHNSYGRQIFDVPQLYNYVVFPSQSISDIPTAFRLSFCSNSLCVASRSGGCSTAKQLPPEIAIVEPWHPPPRIPFLVPPEIYVATNRIPY